MKDLFREIPLSLPIKKSNDLKKKTRLKSFGGYWFLEKMNAMLPHINRRRLRKKEENK